MKTETMKTELVLTRKPGQTIAISGPALVEVESTTPTKTKLRIRADKSVRVMRTEVEFNSNIEIHTQCICWSL